MAARVSAGLSWPDAPDVPIPAGGVVVFSAEDDLETTVVQWLDAAGADRRRIFTSSELLSLENIELLEATIKRAEGARLVVVDPVAAYSGGIDDHRNSDVRALLKPLSELAQRHRLAIVLVTHLNKANSEKSLARVMGSLAWTAAARAVWAVVKDREDASRRLLLPVKCNLAPDLTGLAYRIEGTPPRLAWERDPIAMHADDALAESGPAKKSDDPKAAEWLVEVLTTGPKFSDDIFRKGKSLGFSKNSLYRAKEKGAIKARKSKQAFAGSWFWALPGDDPKREPSGRDPGESGRDLGEHAQDPELFPMDEPGNIAENSGNFGADDEHPLLLPSPDVGPSSPSWGSSASSPLSGPLPIPPDFKPTSCIRCSGDLGGGYHPLWEGGRPVAECWPCVELLST